MSVWSKLGLHANNPDDVPERALSKLAPALLGLDNVDPKLGQRVLYFVVDGVDEGVLDVLRASTLAEVAIDMGSLYRLRPGMPAPPLYRLGEVLAAAFGWGASTSNKLPPWFVALEPLLMHVDRDPDAMVLAELFEAGGETGALVFEVLSGRHHGGQGRRVDEVAARYAETIAGWLEESEETRDRILAVLGGADADPLPFLQWIVLDSVDASKRRRAGVQRLLAKLGLAARPGLERHAMEGANAVRYQAYERLVELFSGAAHAFLATRLEAEKSAKNRALLERILAREESLEGRDVAALVPPLDSVPTVVPLPAGYDVYLRGVLEDLQARRVRVHEQQMKTWNGQWGQRPEVPFCDKALFDPFLVYVVDGVAPPKKHGRDRDQRTFALFVNMWVEPAVVASLVRFEGLHAVHLFRIISGLGFLGQPSHDLHTGTASNAFRAFRRANGGHPDLRELAAIAAANGWRGSAVARTYLRQEGRNRSFGYQPEEAWTYFAEHPDQLRAALGPQQGRYWDDIVRQNAFAALACFPVLPRDLEELAWKAALDTAKAMRPWAQAALTNAPNRLERIMSALGDGKQDVRANAADWLGRLGAAAAIGPLTAVLKKERSDLAKGAMFKALEALGVDLDPYLDRDGLHAEATKKLKKGVPKKLAWFPFDALPEITWKSDGTPVSRESLTWLIVTAHKLKSPESSPLLRLYGEHWTNTEALGDSVLDAWLGEDTRIPTRAELEPKVRQQAKQWARYAPGASVDELFEQLMRQALSQPSGSAQAHKGVLAFVSAFGGASVATKVERYLKDWYGMRAAQCKTLLQMLAQRDDHQCVAVLLATATRFRTKGIRKEAEVQVKQLAERRGWTPAELADRTVPTAGFVFDVEARRAMLPLDMGPRTLHAVLDDTLLVLLDKGEGKLTKSFPKPRKDDDLEKTAASKKAFSAAKKKVKQVVRMQGDRLYEAMCTAQRWDVETWRTHLEEHPIVGRLCERIVWVATRGDDVVASFRPLGDGTLADVDDEPVDLGADLHVSVAHDSNLGAELATLWRAHLTDYEVPELFAQFGAEPFALPEEQRDDLAIKAFVGHTVEAFTLRGRMTKLGYMRGSAEDGGWFYTYARSFPTLGLQVVVSFSGSPLPEENRAVALSEISFVQTGDSEDYERAALCLADVPSVLLSETYNHVHAVAALGSGFDPDWESKVYY